MGTSAGQRSTTRVIEHGGEDHSFSVAAVYFHVTTTSKNYRKASPLPKIKPLAEVRSASQLRKYFYPTTEEWLFCCVGFG